MDRSVEVKDLKALSKYAKEFVSQTKNAVVTLTGSLGAGKTTFVRACIEAIALKNGEKPPRVASPSFVIHQQYALRPTVDHFDFYRLERISDEQLADLGYLEALERVHEGGLLFVEWPEKVSNEASLEASHRIQFQLQSEGRTLVLRSPL